MNKLLILTLMILNTSFVSISSEPATNTTALATNNEPATKKMTKADFLVYVMDYEKNKTEWVFKGKKPCLIDFYADWCGPCRITSPILEELAQEYKGKIDVYKVNVDIEKELAAVFGVKGIPAFLYCPMDGKPSMTSGIARDKEQTKQMFKNNIETLLLKKK